VGFHRVDEVEYTYRVPLYKCYLHIRINSQVPEHMIHLFEGHNGKSSVKSTCVDADVREQYSQG
jgi:hypothetical protein